MRIAAKLSLKLFVHWPLNHECRCSFSELFENSLPEIDAADYYREAKSTIKFIGKHEWFVDYDKFKGSSVINISWRFLLFPDDKISRSHVLAFLPGGDGKGIDFKYHDIPPMLKKDFLYYVNSLIPKQNIIKKVDEFAQQFDDDTVSVQLRTWTNIPGLIDFQRSLFFDIKSAYKVMDRNSGKKFFVSCDSELILKEFRKRYGSRILYYPECRFEKSRDSIQGIQSTLVQLLLLAKNKKIIVSPLTTYPEMAWWFSGCQAEVESIPIPLFNHFLFVCRTFLKSLRQFISVIPDYYLMLCHDAGVSLRPQIRSLPVSRPTRGKIHFFYCTCSKDFQYLTMSLKSLELLRSDWLGKIYVYVDKKDTFSIVQIKELNDTFSFPMEIKITSRPLSWGGVKLLLSEFDAFEKISRAVSPHDYIFKVDSDVLFISDGIFKKVLSENYDAIGQRSTHDNFMEGGSYFLKSALVRRIVRSPIHKAMRYASNSWRCPINESGEDMAISRLVEQNGAKMLLCEYRLHGREFRKLVKWEAIDAYSIIHFSPYVNLRKELMIKMYELLKKKESFEGMT